MARNLHPLPGDGPNDVAISTAANSGGQLTAVVSAVALVFSAYSLWDGALKAPDLKVFVPPLIQYASPFNNSNFEVFAIPVALINDGGRSGTVLSVELEATHVKTSATKRFYSAEFGRWTTDKTRMAANNPFAPVSLAGKGTRTETILFYPKSDKEKPDQLVATEPGTYRFKLILDEADVDDFGILDRIWRRRATSVSFEMELRNYDARAFTNGPGTLPLHSVTGKSAKSGG